MTGIFTNRYFIGGSILVVLLAAWYFYSRRWKKFSDNGQAGALSMQNSGQDIGGGVAFIANEPHGLKVGDVVMIEQETGAKWRQYNGEAVVAYVIAPNIFAIEKAFQGNSPVNPGRFKKI
jgi:hypothetical protein